MPALAEKRSGILPHGMKAGDLPAAIAPDPELRDEGRDAQALIGIAPADDIDHRPGHHGDILRQRADRQGPAFHIVELQETARMVQQLSTVMHDSGRVDMDDILGDQIGKGRHIFMDQRIPALPFPLDQFAFDGFLINLYGGWGRGHIGLFLVVPANVPTIAASTSLYPRILLSFGAIASAFRTAAGMIPTRAIRLPPDRRLPVLKHREGVMTCRQTKASFFRPWGLATQPDG